MRNPESRHLDETVEREKVHENLDAALSSAKSIGEQEKRRVERKRDESTQVEQNEREWGENDAPPAKESSSLPVNDSSSKVRFKFEISATSGDDSVTVRTVPACVYVVESSYNHNS